MKPKNYGRYRRPFFLCLFVNAVMALGLLLFTKFHQPSRLSSCLKALKDPWRSPALKAASSSQSEQPSVSPVAAGTIPPSIHRPMVFTDGIIKGVVTPAQIESMGHRPLFMEEGRNNKFIILNDQLVTTPSLAEFSQALEKGGDIHGRFAVSMSSTFVAGVGVWQFLRAAKSSRSSSFSPYWLWLLPVDIVHWHGSDEREERERDALSGKTITDYRKSGHLISLTATKTSVDFSCGYREVEVTWLASGDLDDDGLEDRLLLISTRATEGSALGIETFVASQSSTKPSRIVLRPFPEGNGVWH
jgi:hypothetical protein